MLTPLEFGSASRLISGIYHPAAVLAGAKGCVLLCNPFGQEAIRSHRLFKVLGDRLSRSGLHVLRFDYFGTGDSEGEDHEGDLESWVDDVLQAHEKLINHSGCAKTSWFGLRLGGSIAALASAKLSTPLDRLVLWEPVLNGPGYLDELAAAHMAGAKAGFGARWALESSLRAKAMAESTSEALGFPLSETLKRQLQGISSKVFGAAHTKTITLLSAGISNEVSSLKNILIDHGTPINSIEVKSNIDWMTNEAMNSSLVPTDAIQAIVDSLLECP